MPDRHAILSASSSKRWLLCPPSARLNAALPDKAGEAAAEGTRAHALAEQRLHAFLDGKEMEKPESVEGEMWEAVTAYVDICIEKITAARKASPDAQVYVEHPLDYSEWVPEGFGTGDMVLISDDSLEVVDFKYGKGVRVEAEGNTQMRFYALGMVHEFGYLFNADRIRMTVVQPRIDNIATSETTVKDLLAWVATKKKAIHEAWEGIGERHAGEHCQFCKARATCKTLAEYELHGVREDLDPQTLSEAEIADIVSRAGSIKKWLTHLEEYALQEALDGKVWAGLKVVAGRSVRKITDADKVLETLEKSGYAEGDLVKPRELQTLTALEKLVGKKKFQELCGGFLDRPPGKPTLVPLSDKREPIAIGSVEDKDFDDSLIIPF